MNFNLKSLAFYGGAIGVVVVLFSLATAYGESSLKAPPSIDGSYAIAAQDLPGCLKSAKLLLMIEQSGIFLNGALLPGDATESLIRKAEERPSLTGRWQNQQLVLQGSLSHLPNCREEISIQSIVGESPQQGKLDRPTLNGNLRLSSQPTVVRFTAQPEPPEQPASEKGH